jgi:hypothetical protein
LAPASLLVPMKVIPAFSPLVSMNTTFTPASIAF